jgi:hypothetical protein
VEPGHLGVEQPRWGAETVSGLWAGTIQLMSRLGQAGACSGIAAL